MPPTDESVKLFYQPKIYLTAELAAQVLGIDLKKANQLLSAPDTYSIVQEALARGVQAALLDILQQMARQRWPQETIPVRVDCAVELPLLPVAYLLTTP
jgi:hypothetical protein